MYNSRNTRDVTVWESNGTNATKTHKNWSKIGNCFVLIYSQIQQEIRAIYLQTAEGERKKEIEIVVYCVSFFFFLNDSIKKVYY